MKTLPHRGKAPFFYSLVCLLLCLATARAETFEDDFDREDTDFTSVANSMLGDSYTVHRGKFSVNGGHLVTEAGAVGDKVLLLEHLRPALDSGGSLRASIDFMLSDFGGNVAVGLSYDYAPRGAERQCHVVRFRWEGESQSIQSLSVPGEGKSMTLPGNLQLQPGRWYTLALNGDSFPDLQYILSDKEGGEIASGFVNLSTIVPFGGAFAVVVDGDETQIRFDNLSVTTD